VWNDGKTQLILLAPRARQMDAAAAKAGVALRSVDLVRSPSSKLVSCGSLVPWRATASEEAAAAASAKPEAAQSSQCGLFSLDGDHEY
jgi:hypothetical protein